MQDLHDLPVAGHRPARGEGHGQGGRRDDQPDDPHAQHHERIRHGGQALDPEPMVVERGAAQRFGQALAQLVEVRTLARIQLQHDDAGHRQLAEIEPGAQPGLQEALGFSLAVDPDIGDAGRRARHRRGLCDIGLDIAGLARAAPGS